jgi:phage regulator Rha-like protein
MANQSLSVSPNYASAINGALMPSATPLSMNSKEIAELVEKRHDNVRRTIAKLAEKGIIRTPQIEFVEEINNLGATIKRETYVFPVDCKRDTYIVVAQLSPEFTARLVDRWQELEGRPMSPAEVLIHQGQMMLALERKQAEQEEAQRQLEMRQESTERRLDQIETAADHFTIIGWHRYAKLEGSLPIAEAAKMGRVATKFCKDHEIEMGEVPDPRFGVVKTYPKWVLEDIFAREDA